MHCAKASFTGPPLRVLFPQLMSQVIWPRDGRMQPPESMAQVQPTLLRKRVQSGCTPCACAMLVSSKVASADPAKTSFIVGSCCVREDELTPPAGRMEFTFSRPLAVEFEIPS
jgi:hypothetical protein